MLTDMQVEEEIAKLLDDEDVILAKKETRIRYKRRQYLYCLRNYKKRGVTLRNEGYTLDNISELLGENDAED